MMKPEKITVLVPTAKAGCVEIPMAPPVQDLNDKVVGFLWNDKPNGDILLLRIKEQLSQRYNLAGTIWQHGRRTGTDDSIVIEELANNADLVINAIGDWGSCTAWSVHAAVELEKRGKPTITICTDIFKDLASITVESLDMPRLPLVIIPHPLGGLKPDEVIERADLIIENIIQNLRASQAKKGQ